MYGERCIFRHEFKAMKKIHRHHYQPNLKAFEAIFAGANYNRDVFMEPFSPAVSKRLEIFRAIHEEYSECQSACTEEDWLEDKDECLTPTKRSRCGSLNTTREDSGDDASSG